MDLKTAVTRTEKRGCQCFPWTRFLVLIFLCIMGFCGMLVYDIPGSLQNAIMHNYSLSEFQFSLLYSFYSWPSVVICFFGGFLIDKYLGVRLAATLFAMIQIVGVSFFVLGGFFDKLWLMLLGRFVFGIGGEMCGVCVNIFVLIWFKGKELNMVFAIIQNTLRFGTSGVYLISTPLLNSFENIDQPKEALSFTLLILCCVTLIPLLLSIILMFLYPIESETEERQAVTNDIQTSDIKNLPITFWMLCISTNLYFHTLYTFLAFTQEFFTTKFNLSVEKANQVSSLFNIIPIVLATLLGILVDRVARNMLFMLAAIIIGIVAHIFAATLCTPYLIIVTFAISSSLMVGPYWPAIAYTVDKNHQGTAYGINQSMFNLISSCGAMIAGWIINDYGYQVIEIYYLGCLCIVLCAFLLLWKLDKKRKNVLNMTSNQRKIYEESL